MNTETVRVEVKAITDADVQAMVMKKLAEVIRLEDVRKEKSKIRSSAQKDESDAKDAAVEELKDLQREMTGGLFGGEKEKFLPTVFVDADNEAIRAIRIEDLELSDAVCSRLIDASEEADKPRCVTLGDLEQWHDDGGRFTKIKTITDKKMIQVRDAIRKACEPFTGKPEEAAA